MTKKLPLLILLALTILGSCGFDKSKFQDLHVPVALAVPVGEAEITDTRLFEMAGDFADNISVNDANTLVMSMRDTVNIVTPSTFQSMFNFTPGVQAITIPIDQTFIDALGPKADTELVTLPEISMPVSLSMGEGMRMDAIVLARSQVFLALDNVGAGYDLSGFNITLPSFVELDSDTPVSFNPGKWLTNTTPHKLTLSHTDESQNTIIIKFGGEVPFGLIKGGAISSRLTIDFNELLTADGYFGNHVVTDTPKITYGVGDEFEQFASMVDYFYMKEPEVTVRVVNQYDTPVIIELSELDISGVRVQIKEGYDRFYIGAKDSSDFKITNYSTISGVQLSELVGVDFHELSIKPNAILNPTQQQIDKIAPEYRPTGYQQATHNTVSSDQTIIMRYTVDMPFDAVIQNVKIVHESPLDFSGMGEMNDLQIESLAFGLTGTNSMPMELSISAYFDAELTQPIFDKPMIFPPSKSVNILPAIPSEMYGDEMIIANVLPESIDKMFDAQKIYLKIGASTKGANPNDPRNTAVQFLSPTMLKLKFAIGARVELQLALAK